MEVIFPGLAKIYHLAYLFLVLVQFRSKPVKTGEVKGLIWAKTKKNICQVLDLRRKVSPPYVKQPVLILVKIEEVTEVKCTMDLKRFCNVNMC